MVAEQACRTRRMTGAHEELTESSLFLLTFSVVRRIERRHKANPSSFSPLTFTICTFLPNNNGWAWDTRRKDVCSQSTQGSDDD